MSDIQDLTERIIEFRDERDWEQFHNSKDLSVALSVESAELLENFLWKEAQDADKNAVKEELADIFMYALLLAHEEGLDVTKIVKEKLATNNLKYPIAKSKGNSTKYTDL